MGKSIIVVKPYKEMEFKVGSKMTLRVNLPSSISIYVERKELENWQVRQIENPGASPTEFNAILLPGNYT